MVFDTEHNGRKTPHAVVDNIYGGKSVDMVWAWCFENDDPEAKLIKKHIPKSKCYTNPGTQDLPDDKFKTTDIRKWHTAVWNQKSANHKQWGVFKTNYEINDILKQATLVNFMG